MFEGHNRLLDKRHEWKPVFSYHERGGSRFTSGLRENYNLDRLIDYQTEDVPGTVKVINPAYPDYSSRIRGIAAILARKKAAFGSLNLVKEISKESIRNTKRKKYN
ncbi:MAG: hypothetical protein HQM08_27900 [Candidatus Riflebacteria bacterium]|nr:hypothetical protein [Candidatus Riflebacteria bacterium]